MPEQVEKAVGIGIKRERKLGGDGKEDGGYDEAEYDGIELFALAQE